MKILTCSETAKILGVSYPRLTILAKKGDIPCARIGRKYLFNEDTLLAWLASGGTAQTPEPPEPMEPFVGTNGIASKIRKIHA